MIAIQMSSLIEELQQHALDPSIPIEDLLRKAWVAAQKLRLTEFSAWIKKELDGYDPSDAIPAYRRIQNEFRAYNPYHGWQSIHWSEVKKVKKLLDPRQIINPAGVIERTAKAESQAEFILPPELKAQLVTAVGADVKCFLNTGELSGIPSHVRNEVLRWSVELEQAGVVGEGLSFSKQDREMARNVEYNFHGGVQNLSNVLGNVTEGGRVIINQRASGGIDPKALVGLAAQLRENLDALVPAAERRRLAREIEVIETEAEAPTPDAGKVKRALTVAGGMIRDAGKGAATSLITQGALTLIRAAIGRLS